MKDPHQNTTTKIYDSNAKSYIESTRGFTFPVGMLESYLDLLLGKKLLDIGCSYGRDIKNLREKGYEVYGIDTSLELITSAEEEIQQYITHGDMTELDTFFEACSFNGISSSASIVHLDFKIGINVCKQVYTLLRPGGLFFLSLKVAPNTTQVFKNSLSMPGTQKKYTYYGEKELEHELKTIGFSILKTHTWQPAGDSWKILICKK